MMRLNMFDPNQGFANRTLRRLYDLACSQGVVKSIPRLALEIIIGVVGTPGVSSGQ
jgi:hypothetical protein